MKHRSVRLLIAFILISSFVYAASPTTPAESARIARLAGLCKLWGSIKYFHPDMATKDIDWDLSLVKTIPKVNAAQNPAEYREAIKYMLGLLGDPETTIVETNAVSPKSDSKVSSQPVLRKTDDDIAVLNLTDYRQFSSGNKMEELRRAFTEASHAKAIVLDVRRLAGTDSDVYFFNSTFNQLFPLLLEKDLRMASYRHRMYSGYPTQTGGAYGGYYSAFAVQDATSMKARGASGSGRPMAIVINPGTVGLSEMLVGLQSAGLAVVVREGESSGASTDEDLGEGYNMQLPDGVNVIIRTTELIAPDGSIGFSPDQAVPAGTDNGVNAALASLREGKTHHASHDAHMVIPNQKLENPYPEMTSPSSEYRLLALFRFWNVIEYFFPYKHLIDSPWDSVLPEMIPQFEAANDSLAYHLAVARLATRIQDTHGFVNSKVLADYIGTGRPPLEVKSIQGQTVLTHIFTVEGQAAPEGIKVGDVVLAVDGEDITARRDRIGQYFAHSTPQALRWRIDNSVLGGAKDSPIALKIRKASGQISTVTLKRNSSQRKAQREGPVYKILPSGYGYIDLERLTTADVDQAFEELKDTPAIIFDVRGYPKGVFSMLGAHLAAAKIPTSRFGEPRPSSPDSTQVGRLEFLQYAQPGPERYKGKVVALINAEAISQSEHTCLWLESTAGAKFIGSPTNGANGDVTQTVLPGGIVINFSGHDVRHADGRQLQRLGIQPDVKIEPTIAGIRAGRDEVLEKAVEYLKQSLAASHKTKPAN